MSSDVGEATEGLENEQSPLAHIIYYSILGILDRNCNL